MMNERLFRFIIRAIQLPCEDLAEQHVCVYNMFWSSQPYIKLSKVMMIVWPGGKTHVDPTTVVPKEDE